MSPLIRELVIKCWFFFSCRKSAVMTAWGSYWLLSRLLAGSTSRANRWTVPWRHSLPCDPTPLRWNEKWVFGISAFWFKTLGRRMHYAFRNDNNIFYYFFNSVILLLATIEFIYFPSNLICFLVFLLSYLFGIIIIVYYKYKINII